MRFRVNMSVKSLAFFKNYGIIILIYYGVVWLCAEVNKNDFKRNKTA